MSFSYRFAQSRVDGILKHLTSEDREVLEAYIADAREEARQGRPVWDLAKWLGVGIPVAATVAAVMVFVGPKLPSIYLPADECDECEVCPEPPEPLDWSAIPNYKMRWAEQNNMTCLWPDDTWTFMCTIEAPKPTEPEQVPVVVPQ